MTEEKKVLIQEKSYVGSLAMYPGGQNYRDVTVEMAVLDEDTIAFRLCADMIVKVWKVGTIEDAVKAYKEEREK